MTRNLKETAIGFHHRIPGLRRLPLPAVVILSGVVLANAAVWAAVAIVLVNFTT